MKKIRLAIVGPLDSVMLIHSIAEERSEIIDSLPIVYRDASEVIDILTNRMEEADVWLFSGKVPYRHALAAGFANHRPFLYIPHTGSSLYRVLLQITYREKMVIDRISFDSFSRREIEETFLDCGLALPTMEINDYEGIVAAATMTAYHYRLWQEGKSRIAVTGFLSTYEELKRLGMPAFRVAPTRHNVRTILDTAISTGQAMYFKDSQIAVHHIAIDGYENFVREALSSYQVKRVEFQLYELLMNYTEKVKGSIVIHGHGQYTIYSTRGIVAELTREFTVMPILEEITCKLAVYVSGGIGFGQTAHAAEENAHIALGLSRQIGQGRWMVVKDDRSVVGPLSSATHLEYSIRTENSEAQLLAQKLSLSTTTVNRLFAAFRKLDGQTVSADELAGYLAITPRSARRLLSGLVDHRLAQVTGEEVAGKGRPRKLYKVFLDKLAGIRPKEDNSQDKYAK